ncbi:MAG: DUF2442 domain-containing protein [Acidobacteriota bacterium]
MPKPVEVRALANFRIWLRYDDGIQGEVDLSNLADRGVCRAWHDPTVFDAVSVAPHGAIEWGSGIDLCPDSLYMQLTGQSPEEYFRKFKAVHADA